MMMEFPQLQRKLELIKFKHEFDHIKDNLKIEINTLQLA